MGIILVLEKKPTKQKTKQNKKLQKTKKSEVDLTKTIKKVGVGVATELHFQSSTGRGRRLGVEGHP